MIDICTVRNSEAVRKQLFADICLRPSEVNSSKDYECYTLHCCAIVPKQESKRPYTLHVSILIWDNESWCEETLEFSTEEALAKATHETINFFNDIQENFSSIKVNDDYEFWTKYVAPFLETVKENKNEEPVWALAG